jgi:hypothetical protein
VDEVLVVLMEGFEGGLVIVGRNTGFGVGDVGFTAGDDAGR